MACETVVYDARVQTEGETMQRVLILAMLIVISQAALYGAQQSEAEQEIRKLDDQRIKAILDQDIPTLDRLMADDFTYTHQGGVTETKAEFLGAMKSGTGAFRSVKLSDVKVRIFGNAAVIAGRCDITAVRNGKDFAIPMHFTEVYSRTAGRLALADSGNLRDLPGARSSLDRDVVRNRVGLLGVDAEFGDGFLDHRGLNLALAHQLVQRRQRDEPRIHFEEIAQGRAAFAAAEAIGAERRDAARHPAVDEIRQHLQVVRGGHQHAGRVREALGYIRNAGLFRRDADNSSARSRCRRCKAPCSW